jgi:hypothetical protein
MPWPIINVLQAHIPDAVRHIEDDVSKLYAPMVEVVSEGLVWFYKQETIAVGAVDTGWFLNHIRVLNRGPRYAVVGAGPEVPYSGAIETGWVERDGSKFPGRYPAARAIALVEPLIGDALAHQMWR